MNAFVDIISYFTRSEPNVYACTYCNLTFQNSHLQGQHESQYHKRKKKVVLYNDLDTAQCPCCAKNFDFPYGDKKRKKRKLSVSMGILRRHMATKHNVVGPHSCSYCNYTAATKRGYVQHMSKRHSPQYLMSCQVCDYTCEDSAGKNGFAQKLYNHYRLKHMDTALSSAKLCYVKNGKLLKNTRKRPWRRVQPNVEKRKKGMRNIEKTKNGKRYRARYMKIGKQFSKTFDTQEQCKVWLQKELKL